MISDLEFLILISLLAAAAILYCLPLFMASSGDRVAHWFERRLPRLHAAGGGLMLAGLICMPVALFLGWLFER